ncbi:MAG: hypothetical protein PHV51_05350 [Methanosarcinaceae archaeon]|nr:hypothetical protein [Methanosarcinaceae archaeon]
MISRKRNTRNLSARFLLLGIIAFSIIAIAVPAVSAVNEISAERNILQDKPVKPGENFTVIVNISSNQENLCALSLNEDMPAGWTATPVDDDGAELNGTSLFKASTNEWIWTEFFHLNSRKSVVYDITVPADASNGIYKINGNVSVYNVNPIGVSGSNEIEVGDNPVIPANTLYVTSTSVGGANEESSVGIYLNNSFNPKVGSATIKLYYDESLIEVISCDAIEGAAVSSDLGSPISISVATTSGIPNGNAWISNITFISKVDEEHESELGLVLKAMSNLNLPPEDLISSTAVKNGTFSTGSGLEVHVVDTSGNPINADFIKLNDLIVKNTSNFNFIGLADGNYSLNVTKAGYKSVKSTISYKGSSRAFTVTLAKEFTKPILTVAEGNTAITGSIYNPPEKLNALRNEQAYYNLSLTSSGKFDLTFELPVRYTINKPIVRLDGVVIPYTLENGTFTAEQGEMYSSTNATLVVSAIPSVGEHNLELVFNGYKLGKSMIGDEVTSLDALLVLHYEVGNMNLLPTYDYPDVNRDGYITSLDSLLILHQTVGNVNEYYELV